MAKRETRAQRLDRISADMSDRDVLDNYARAEREGDELAARIFGAEADHRDCWL